MKIRILIILSLFNILFIACSAVPTTRYEKKQKIEENKEEKKENNKRTENITFNKTLNEDYDIKRFSPDLSYDKKNEKSEIKFDKEIWFEFPTKTEINNSSDSPKIKGTSEGYRVLVFSSDDLDELKEMQIKLEENKGIHQVYSIFEPPFYKLYIGDFTLLEDANSLKHKLIQLDFKESKVVRTTINIF